MPPFCFFTSAWCFTGQCRKNKRDWYIKNEELHLLWYIRISDIVACTFVVWVHMCH
jgi:hypothetical protein